MWIKVEDSRINFDNVLWFMPSPSSPLDRTLICFIGEDQGIDFDVPCARLEKALMRAPAGSVLLHEFVKKQNESNSNP